jgi:hypothetical protein
MLLKSPREATENCISGCTQIREAQTSMKYAYKENNNNGKGENVDEQSAQDPLPERKLVDGNWVSSITDKCILLHE